MNKYVEGATKIAITSGVPRSSYITGEREGFSIQITELEAGSHSFRGGMRDGVNVHRIDGRGLLDIDRPDLC